MTNSTSTPDLSSLALSGPHKLIPGLYNASCLDLVAKFESNTPDLTFIHADPPWRYSGGKNSKQRGLAAKHYGGLLSTEIRDHLIATYPIAAPNAYLAVWVTFPKLLEFLSTYTWKPQGKNEDPLAFLGDPKTPGGAWRYVTGGAWAKTGSPGVGYHWTGDAEILLLHKKGKPRTRTNASNSWVEARRGHSWKSLQALRDLVEACTGPRGKVLDLYAGDSGDLLRICRTFDRQYYGTELDAERYQAALLRLAQSDLPGMALDLPRGKKLRIAELRGPFAQQGSFMDFLPGEGA